MTLKILTKILNENFDDNFDDNFLTIILMKILNENFDEAKNGNQFWQGKTDGNSGSKCHPLLVSGFTSTATNRTFPNKNSPGSSSGLGPAIITKILAPPCCCILSLCPAFLTLQSGQSPSMELLHIHSSRKRPYLLNRTGYRAEILHGERSHKDLPFMFSALLHQTSRFGARTSAKSAKIRAFLPLQSRLWPSNLSLVSSSVPGSRQSFGTSRAPVLLWSPAHQFPYNPSQTITMHIRFLSCSAHVHSVFSVIQ